MARFEIKLDTKALSKGLEKIKEDINKGVEEGLLLCASEIKQMQQRQIENTTGQGEYVPSGQLKRSVTIMPLEWSPYGASTASYAGYINNGTGIYNPSGRQGGWFYPVGDGTYRFTLGLAPHYFVDDTYEFYKDKAPSIIQQSIFNNL